LISGILPVDKPLGWTSHDVVARVRKLTGQRQVGHAGTLDPLATGVLLVMLGQATRLSSYLMAAPKAYCAEVVLGAFTATDDAEAPAQDVTAVTCLTRTDIERCLLSFLGSIRQTPPAYAAVRQGGEKLYALARKGVPVEPVSRQVEVHGIHVQAWSPPRLMLGIECGSGTYIRSMARDLGAALGVGGYLHGLRRVASGTFHAKACYTLPELESAASIEECLEPLDRAVLELPAAVLHAVDAQRVQHGLSILAERQTDGLVRLYRTEGTLLALGEATGRQIKPVRVFTGARQ